MLSLLRETQELKAYVKYEKFYSLENLRTTTVLSHYHRSLALPIGD